MKTTRDFEGRVLRKRPYIRRDWCEEALRHPLGREQQSGGHVGYWKFVKELGKY